MGLSRKNVPTMEGSLEFAQAMSPEWAQGDSLNLAQDLYLPGLFGQEYLQPDSERLQDNQHRLLTVVPTRPAELKRPDQCHCSY